MQNYIEIFIGQELNQILSSNYSLISNFHQMPFADKIIVCYMEYTVSQLIKLIEPNQQDIIEKLQAFLAAQWQLVQGTMCSYTAIPNNEVTLLLCKIAKEL